MKWCSMSKQSILFCTGKTDGYSHYWLLKRKQTARHYYLRNHIHDSIIYNEEIFTCLCVHNFDSFKCALFFAVHIDGDYNDDDDDDGGGGTMFLTKTNRFSALYWCFAYTETRRPLDDHTWIACCAIVLVCSWLRFVLHTRDYFGSLFTLYFNLCCIYMTAIQRDCKAVGIRNAILVRCFFYACEWVSICAQCAYIYWWILLDAFSLSVPASLSFHLTSISYIAWRAEVLLIWHECARAC